MRLSHVRVLANDSSASYGFYRDGLGLATEWNDHGAYAEFAVGREARLAIFPRATMAQEVPMQRPGDGVLLVLHVGDVDAACADLRARGLEPVDEPHDRPEWGLCIAHVRDPDGNLLELFHDLEWV